MKLVREPLSDQLYQILKLKILKGDIEAGSVLSNRSLQEEFQVSSTPVRDAINHLHQDGLIEEITRSGAKVMSVNLEKALEYNETLMILTTGAIELSLKKTKSVLLLNKLKKAVEKQKKYLETDLYFQYDYEFHHVFFENSENSYLEKIFQKFHAIAEFLVRSVYSDDNFFTAREKSVFQHEQIIDCVEKNQVEEAKHFNKLHYLHAEEVLLNLYRAKKER